ILLTAVALAAPALADALTPEQQAAVERLIRDTLKQHPDLVIEALKAAEQQDEADAAARARGAIKAEHAALYADPASPVGGNPTGDVTLIEFFDYRCPYCKAIEPALEQLIAADGRLRIVYKEFPILGPASVHAARVALAARAQGKYDAFHRAMMAARGPLDDTTVDRIAANLGLDMAKLERAAEGDGPDRIIAANYRLAQRLAIEGTPAFIVGDDMLQGLDNIGTLRAAIAKARRGG
ncbi:MAG: DsbA family protein, partial [Stellaceae bacterium]